MRSDRNPTGLFEDNFCEEKRAIFFNNCAMRLNTAIVRRIYAGCKQYLKSWFCTIKYKPRPAAVTKLSEVETTAPRRLPYVENIIEIIEDIALKKLIIGQAINQ